MLVVSATPCHAAQEVGLYQGAQRSLRNIEGVMTQWCNNLNLQTEQSGGVGSIPSYMSVMTRGRGLDYVLRLISSQRNFPSGRKFFCLREKMSL